ncbi:hypothetical protein DAPPUDRAFT_115352 [Daphnia pulex]|uniref:Uncharacterized protein n=1 Tax=Daphnia pulex TaxID=6669 RepID=E9HL33_DAPPU|nr:hypothetical protein DAPPUDRAFT_115352 [Daphnia pulex]|eukprot:EFX67534.1 hypothetical protein DAPPUDRAFT_115352 [Daphnia pulex]
MASRMQCIQASLHSSYFCWASVLLGEKIPTTLDTFELEIYLHQEETRKLNDCLDCLDTLVVQEVSVRSSTDENLVDLSLFLNEDKSFNSVVPAGQDKSTIATTEEPENDLPELSPEQLPVDPVALALNHLPAPNEEQTPIISAHFPPPPPPDGDTTVSNLPRQVIEAYLVPVENESFPQISIDDIRQFVFEPTRIRNEHMAVGIDIPKELGDFFEALAGAMTWVSFAIEHWLVLESDSLISKGRVLLSKRLIRRNLAMSDVFRGSQHTIPAPLRGV